MVKYLISIEKGQLDNGKVYPVKEKDKCADIFLPHPNKSFSDTRSFPKAFYQNREHRNTFKSTTLHYVQFVKYIFPRNRTTSN